MDDSKLIFLLSSLTLIPWLAFAFLQFKLIKRINIVSKAQHKIPSNVYWMKRARQAIETDAECHAVWKKRNVSAFFFLVSLLLAGSIMGYIVINEI